MKLCDVCRSEKHVMTVAMGYVADDGSFDDSPVDSLQFKRDLCLNCRIRIGNAAYEALKNPRDESL